MAVAWSENHGTMEGLQYCGGYNLPTRLRLEQLFCQKLGGSSPPLQQPWVNHIPGGFPQCFGTLLPSGTPFFKRAYKTNHNPGLQASLDALPSFAAWSKIKPDFTILSGLKIEVTK